MLLWIIIRFKNTDEFISQQSYGKSFSSKRPRCRIIATPLLRITPVSHAVRQHHEKILIQQERNACQKGCVDTVFLK